MAKQPNRYGILIEKIFFDHYTDGASSFEFERQEIEDAAADAEMKLPKNIGDVLYSFRFRYDLPKNILETQPSGMEWLIELAGRARYRFNLVKLNRIKPNTDLITISIPDATPEIIRTYSLDDEQALLAIVRYNRLLDTFLGITTYSMQNHLRTTVKNIGQIEIDELYVGLDKYGCHYVIPVQAKGGNDKISIVQTKQDLAWCEAAYPGIRPKAISVQFMDNDKIAMFELTIQGDEIKVVEERHYKLVTADALNKSEIQNYRDN